MFVRRSVLCRGLALSACGGEEVTTPPVTTPTEKYSTSAKILAYLEGKTFKMEGAAIPSHPNGFDEDVNFGSATQCYKSVAMTTNGGRVQITSTLGTLENAPMTGVKGTCNHDMQSAELMFDSTAVLIENVKGNGTCFDYTVTYPGFGQEGRGSISADGKTVVLELYFKDQATGHRCAQGDVGAASVTLNQNAFTGNSKQTYTLVE